MVFKTSIESTSDVESGNFVQDNCIYAMIVVVNLLFFKEHPMTQ